MIITGHSPRWNPRSDVRSVNRQDPSMSKKTKLISFGVGVVLVAGILAFTASKKGAKATEVKIEAVERRDLTASVTASGQVRPQTKVDVASDVSGKIISLKVKEGDMVSKG